MKSHSKEKRAEIHAGSFLHNYRIPSLLVAGILITALLTVFVYTSEKAAAEREFKDDSSRVISLLQSWLNTHEIILKSLQKIHAGAGHINRRNFEIIAKTYLEQFKGLEAIGWIPVVSKNEISKYLNQTAAEGINDFMEVASNPESITQHAEQSEEYHPILYLEPHQKYSSYVGMNIESMAISDSVLEEAKSCGMAASESIDLGDDNHGFIAILPINKGSLGSESDEIEGFYLVILNARKLVTQLMEDGTGKRIAFVLSDYFSNDDRGFLYSYPNSLSVKASQSQFDKKSYEGTISAFGRKWRLNCSQPPQRMGANHNVSGLILLGGFLLTGLSGKYLNLSKRESNKAIQFAEQQSEAKEELEAQMVERRRIEQNLLFEREQHISILDGMDQFITVTDPQTHELLYANKSMEKLFGKVADHAKCYEVFQHKSQPCAFCRMRHVFDAQGDIHTWELENEDPPFSAKINDMLIKWPDGRNVKFTWAADVTEVKQLEAKLDQSRKYAEGILSNMPLGIVVCEERRLVWMNKHAQVLLGLEENAEYSGMGSVEFYKYEEEYHLVGELTEIALATNTVQKTETTLVVKTGTELIAEVIISASNDERGSQKTIIALSDITWKKRAEKKILESERRFRNTFDNIGLIGVILDTQGNVTFCNEACEQILGRTKSEIIGVNWFDSFIPDSDGRQTLKYFNKTLSNGFQSIVHRENEILTPDGILKLIRWTNTELHDTKGALVGFACLGEDVTEIRRKEAALKQSESRFRKVLENLHVGVWMSDDSGRMIACNAAADQIWKGRQICDPAHCVGCISLRSRTGAPIRPDKCAVARALKEGQATVDEIVEIHNSDGTCKTILNSAAPLFDESGAIENVIVISHDLTEKIEAQQALQAAENRTRSIVDASPVGIRVTQDGRYVFVNESFARMFGYGDSSELIGKSPESVISPDGDDSYLNLSEIKGPVQLERMGLRKDGSVFDIGVWATEMDYYGKPASLAFVSDISESKSLRDQLAHAQKMEAVGALAGGVAHDFNNLLTIIIGFTELLLLDKESGNPDRNELEKVLASANRGADLVQNLLMFSRRSETVFKPIRLNNEINQMVSMLSRVINKMIELEISLSDDDLPINGDSGQISQAMINLVVNSSHAMPDGGQISIRTENTEIDDDYCTGRFDAKPGRYVVLSVSDTGLGMSKQVISRIFEPFYTTKGPGQGTGLGLSMVYGIVRNHGGHIECISEPGHGATFKCFFPVVEDFGKFDPQITQLPISRANSETILLVDDEESIRSMGAKIFGNAGYKVVVADNGLEALKILKNNGRAIDLVLLDLIMPQMDGKQCLAQILAISPAIKVIICTGSLQDQSVEMLQRGALRYITKPFKTQDLLAAVREVLDGEKLN